MLTIKPLLLLLAWLAGGALALLVMAVMLAPYVGSVLSNIGRRPVVLQTARSSSASQRHIVRTQQFKAQQW
jgi:hypothetical protein